MTESWTLSILNQIMDPIKNLVVDGVEYPVESFSTKVQEVVQVRSIWSADLARERSKALKTEAALRQLDIELQGLVELELNAKKEAANQANVSAKPTKAPKVPVPRKTAKKKK